MKFLKKIFYLYLQWKNINLSLDEWWKLRECNLVSRMNSLKTKINKKRYFLFTEKNCSEIPLETRISEQPVFPHGLNGILISKGAQIGGGCVIFQQVTIGSNTIGDSKTKGSPTIGENVYIGAGAKIIGKVTVGNNVRIGANCIVVDDVPENSIVVLNKPRVIVKSGLLDNRFKKYDEADF